MRPVKLWQAAVVGPISEDHAGGDIFGGCEYLEEAVVDGGAAR
jgi:hypothetical protein